MRALSFAQPWAELILRGVKTIELRTWRSEVRGTIVVHASKRVRRDDCEAYDVDPGTVPLGALVGTVDIVDMVDLSGPAWDELRAEHLHQGANPGDLVGWRLANPRRFDSPIPYRGKLGFFYVDLETRETDLPATSPGTPESPASNGTSRSLECLSEEYPFALEVVPGPNHTYMVALHQRSPGGLRQEQDGPLVRIGGKQLLPALDMLLATLRRAGYHETDLSRGRQEPFRLREELGVRLGLVLLALAPLLKRERAEDIARGIDAMVSEEAYYWFSKASDATAGSRALRALRLLLAEE